MLTYYFYELFSLVLFYLGSYMFRVIEMVVKNVYCFKSAQFKIECREYVVVNRTIMYQTSIRRVLRAVM